MRLQIVAPVLVDFHLVPGTAVVDEQAYSSFWTTVATSVAAEQQGASAAVAVEFPHTRAESPFNRYRTISTDSLQRSLSVVRWTLPVRGVLAGPPDDLPPDAPSGPPSDADLLIAGATSLEFDLRDHGIGLLMVDFGDVGPVLDSWGGSGPENLDRLQAAAVAAGAHLARQVHSDHVAPLVEQVRQLDRRGAIVLPALTGRGAGQVMWVARALLVTRGEPDLVPVVAHWTKDVPLDDGEPAPEERAQQEGHWHIARWLNYVYQRDPLAGSHGDDGFPTWFGDRWDAMCHAQFFYAALDDVDTQLSEILATALATDTVRELSSLRSSLERAARRSHLVGMHLHDTSKHLKRSVDDEMQQVLDRWDLDGAVRGPVETKAALCRERIEDLHSKRLTRSALYTDLILMAIGVTSIVGTSVALADFGRRMASDSTMSVFDIGSGDLTSWFAAQPLDAIVLTSLVVSACLIVVYVVLRRLHES